MSLAAFLMMKGLTLISANRVLGKFEFIFEDQNILARSLEREYLSSEIPRYDASMRHLKRRLYNP
jgi:hypothetical protein